jgi:osmotically-inducible protein OsmY
MRVQCGRIAADHVCGTASLSGPVRSERESRAIEVLVWWHDSVRNVANNLRIAMAPGALRHAG